MRISGIFVLIALSLIFEGAFAWWAAAARGIEPIILSFGTAFAAHGLNDQPNHNVQLFDMIGWFKNIFSPEKEKVNEDYEILGEEVKRMKPEERKYYDKMVE